MRYFKIPFVVEEEEKIFGGYISLRQAMYLFLCMLGIRAFWFPFPFVINLIMFMVFAGVMISFAFLKIDGMYFDAYAVTVLKYYTRQRRYTYGEDR